MPYPTNATSAEQRSACTCLYCRGEDGRRLTAISFDIAEAGGLIVAAKRNRVTIKPADTIFVVNGERAVGCVRFIRRRLARLCGCWVAPESRGRGLGSLLVRHRVAFIEHHTAANVIDTFAFRPRLYLSLGFEERTGYKIGTTLLRMVLRHG